MPRRELKKCSACPAMALVFFDEQPLCLSCLLGKLAEENDPGVISRIRPLRRLITDGHGLWFQGAA